MAKPVEVAVKVLEDTMLKMQWRADGWEVPAIDVQRALDILRGI